MACLENWPLIHPPVSTQECAGVTTSVLHLVGRHAGVWPESPEQLGGDENGKGSFWKLPLGR